MNSLLILLLGQGREHRQKCESTTVKSPQRFPVLSVFKLLALISELKYRNSGTGRNMSQGDLRCKSCSKYFSNDRRHLNGSSNYVNVLLQLMLQASSVGGS